MRNSALSSFNAHANINTITSLISSPPLSLSPSSSFLQMAGCVVIESFVRVSKVREREREKGEMVHDKLKKVQKRRNGKSKKKEGRRGREREREGERERPFGQQHFDIVCGPRLCGWVLDEHHHTLNIQSS